VDGLYRQKQEMNQRHLIYVLLIVTFIGIGAFMGQAFIQASRKAEVVDQAVWIARLWDQKLSMGEICTEASRKSGNPISTADWTKGSGRLLALGPTIDGLQISVDQDLSVQWIAANPHH
jgi:hypothetical protein